MSRTERNSLRQRAMQTYSNENTKVKVVNFFPLLVQHLLDLYGPFLFEAKKFN